MIHFLYLLEDLIQIVSDDIERFGYSKEHIQALFKELDTLPADVKLSILLEVIQKSLKLKLDAGDRKISTKLSGYVTQFVDDGARLKMLASALSRLVLQAA
jgi:hypothetical protein